MSKFPFHLRIFRQPASTGAFPEEPPVQLGDDFGFFHPSLLLNNDRYEILRKLGQGQSSSTWLVSDQQCVYKSCYPRSPHARL